MPTTTNSPAETWRMDKLLDLCAAHGFTIATPANAFGTLIARATNPWRTP